MATSFKIRPERHSLTSLQHFRKPVLKTCYDLEEKQRYRELLQTLNVNGFSFNRRFANSFTSTTTAPPTGGVNNYRGDGGAYSNNSLCLETTLNELKRLQHTVAEPSSGIRLLSASTPIRQRSDKMGSVYSTAKKSLDGLDSRGGAMTSSSTTTSSTPRMELRFDKSPPATTVCSSSTPEIISLDGEDILASYEKEKKATATQMILDKARRSFSSIQDFLNLSKLFEKDPSNICSKYRRELSEERSWRQKRVDELSIEANLRHKARLTSQKSLENEIRCRMRFEGLIIAEPDEEESFPELTDAQLSVVQNSLASGYLDEVLVEDFSIPLKRRDIQTLAGLNWLNDEVINFYFNLLMRRSGKNGLPSVYVFSTFFYPKLRQGGHVSLKRWTRKVDVFAYDLILIPIHLGVHWCLAVVDFQKKLISYYDSMGGSNRECVEAIKQYLVDESLEKKKQTFDLNGWKENFLKNIPQQMNGSDCGMFACKFAEYACRNAEINFTQQKKSLTGMHSGEDVAIIIHAKDGQKHSGLQHVADGVIDFIAGTAGAVASVYTGQPLDTIKVKMQTFPQLYKNAAKCFVDTFKNDGIRRGLYAGTVPALAANAAENSVLFAAYGFCQKAVAKLFQRDVRDLKPFHNACAGSMAAVFSTFTLCPTELVKCRLQAVREMHAINKPMTGGASFVHIGPWSMTRQIFRNDGFLGFFKGFWPTFAREVPGYFFFFGGYELSRYLLTPAGKTKDDLGLLRTVFCGGLGGVALWVVIFPADVVKSRVQIKGQGSLFATMLEIFKNEGIRTLYKGLGPTVIRTFFGTGALFVAYEYTKKNLHIMTDGYF